MTGQCGQEAQKTAQCGQAAVHKDQNAQNIQNLQNKGMGVYLHIPFCVSRCRYCDFNTYSGMEQHQKEYFEAMTAEIRAFFRAYGAGNGSGCDHNHNHNHNEDHNHNHIETVFFGGGTPSCVDSAFVSGLLRELDGGGSAEYRECTIEINPGTLTPDKLEAYKRSGINRLSFGLQSTQDHHLSALGRIHRYGEYEKNVRMAQKLGFENISTDLIFGLPNQTLPEWKQTLETVVAGGVKHLSCYSLSLEEGTPLHADVRDGILPAPDEDTDREMYGFTLDYLKSVGLEQYELSNFAVPGFECLHNLKYWTGAPYIGFGAGAHSYYGGKRFSNHLSIPEYIRSVTGVQEMGNANAQDGVVSPDNGGHCLFGVKRAELAVIDEHEREKEHIILHLRLNGGISTEAFRREFHHEFIQTYSDILERLSAEGLLNTVRGKPPRNGTEAAGNNVVSIKLSKKGMDLANRVLTEFI